METKTTHTPGPWNIGANRIHEYNDHGDWCVPVFAHHAPSGDKLPANAYARDREQARANARLIAAAPDLLEALEAAHAYIMANMPKGGVRKNFSALNDHACLTKKTHAAIAKAKGEA